MPEEEEVQFKVDLNFEITVCEHINITTKATTNLHKSS